MKKVFLVLLVLGMLSTLFVGCGKEDSKTLTDTETTTKSTTEAKAEETSNVSTEGPVIAYICKDLSQEWFVNTSTAMKEHAMSLGAKEVILFDTAMSPDKYLTALDSAISRNVDVLIVTPPDQKLSQITVDRCNEAGIKLMAESDGLIDENGVHIAPVLELDAYAVGLSQGEWLATYYKENKLSELKDTTAYMVMTMDEVSSCVPRAEGALASFLKNVPDFASDKVIKANYDGTSDKGFNVVAATITANPYVTHWIITAPNDEGAVGATRALEQAGIDKEACVVGLGGYLGLNEIKKEYSAFKAFAYIDPIVDGKAVATAAMRWVTDDIVAYSEYIKEGEEFGIYPFGAVMADKTNYKEVMGVD